MCIFLAYVDFGTLLSFSLLSKRHVTLEPYMCLPYKSYIHAYLRHVLRVDLTLFRFSKLNEHRNFMSNLYASDSSLKYLFIVYV